MSVIHIRDNKEIIEVRFEDIKKYHGALALMAIAVAFRVQQAAIHELFGAEPPQRARSAFSLGMRALASAMHSNS